MNAPLAWAFASGMAATVNPCGFALLPTYLTYFLGLSSDDAAGADRAGVGRALVVSATMTTGFIAVFGTMGFLWGSLRSILQPNLPYATMAVGAAVVVLGIAMLAGYEPTVRLPRLELSGGGRELSSMFLYGVSYAVASLSCTLPLFAGVLTSTLETSNAVAAGLTVAAFGLGMGVLLAVLTLAVALGRTGLVRSLRSVLPRIQRISGAMLVFAGLFVAYYGWTEVRVLRGDRVTGGPAVAAQDWQSRVQSWVVDHQAVLGWSAGIVVLIATGWAIAARITPPTGSSGTALGGTANPPEDEADTTDAVGSALRGPAAR